MSKKYHKIIKYLIEFAEENNISVVMPNASENATPISSLEGRVVIISKPLVESNRQSPYMLAHELAHLLGRDDIKQYMNDEECMSNCENVANVFGLFLVLTAYVDVYGNCSYSKVMNELCIPNRYKYKVINILDLYKNDDALWIIEWIAGQYSLYKNNRIDFYKYKKNSNDMLKLI